MLEEEQLHRGLVVGEHGLAVRADADLGDADAGLARLLEALGRRGVVEDEVAVVLLELLVVQARDGVGGVRDLGLDGVHADEGQERKGDEQGSSPECRSHSSFLHGMKCGRAEAGAVAREGESRRGS